MTDSVTDRPALREALASKNEIGLLKIELRFLVFYEILYNNIKYMNYITLHTFTPFLYYNFLYMDFDNLLFEWDYSINMAEILKKP